MILFVLFFEGEGAVIVVGDYNARATDPRRTGLYICCDTHIDGIDGNDYDADTPLPKILIRQFM